MKAFNKSAFLLIILLCVSFFANAASTGHVLGQVTEKETGNPVAFARIIFENKMDKIEVQANEHGYYYASHLPTGKYQMRLTFNNRIFVINHIRVFDSYSNQVDVAVSNDSLLPAMVELESKEPLISSITSTDVTLNNSTFHQPTRTLGEALGMQPGMDVVNGRLYVKGSDQVRFFIDGTPVLGNASMGRVW
ncbi:MAG: hypothetical protein V4615_17400 [Bacteroidota bacterium]